MSHKRQHADVSVSSGNVGVTAQSPSSKESISGADRIDSPLVERRPSKTDGVESDASSDHPRSRKKPEPVKSACTQCQKRKTKCSGQRPVCLFCGDRSLQCSWDIGDGLTRTADLKQKLLEARQGSDDLCILINALRSGSDELSTMLLAKLRMGATTEDLADSLRDRSLGESAEISESHPEGYYSQSSERSEGYLDTSLLEHGQAIGHPHHPFDSSALASPFSQQPPINPGWSPNSESYLNSNP